MADLKKLKVIIFSVLGVSTLLIISGIVALGFYLSSLNEIVTEGLRTKKFLEPTLFYAKPFTFSARESVTFEQVKSSLKSKNYRQRQPEQRIQKGDFQVLDSTQCRQISEQMPESASSCLKYSIQETFDPELKDKGPQILAFNEQMQLISTGEIQTDPVNTNVQTYSATFEASLEPEVFLQLIESEPIQQTYKELGEFPPQCLKAVLAIEDSKFLEHGGVSWTGLLRAAVNNAIGGARQGGSTITQQLVKNYFLNSEKTLKRKFNEFWMSLILENHSSKDQIFETYLNIIYLGQNGSLQIRGYASAAQYYFNKDLSQLNLSDCSLLAAILNSPGLFNPFTKSENAKKRKSLVLSRMKSLDWINEAEEAEALQAPLPTAKKDNIIETAPYYISAVKKEVSNLGIEGSGHHIFSGLNLKAQKAAQDAVQIHLEKLSAENKFIKSLKDTGHQLEGSALLASNIDGLIQAIVGGRNFKLTQFNRATDGHRQIGSVMKPLVYLAAIENTPDFNPMTPLRDEAFTIRFEGQNWTPENYSKKYLGEVPAFYALKSSLNGATAKLGMDVGLNKIVDLAKRLGAQSELKAWPSLSLGSFEMKPVEVLEIYLALARWGSHTPLSTLRSITSAKGEVLFIREVLPNQAVDSNSVAVLTGILKQVPISGSGQSISKSGFLHPSAGKTGTTSDSKDAWYAGYTPNWTAVTWVGYDDNTSHRLTGASGAVPIWTALMKEIVKNETPEDFSWPDGVELKSIKYSDPEEVSGSAAEKDYELTFRK